MITHTHQLSESALNALQSLLNTCQENDKASIPVYPHLLAAYRPGPPSLLYYQQKQLIAFIASFHFYPKAVEIALLVHPAYRRQGIAKQLWSEMSQKIQSSLPPLTDSIVSSPHQLNQIWFKQHHFQFEHTEYDMHCTPYIPNHTHQHTDRIEQATHDDLKALHTIDHACFNPNRPDPIERLTKLLQTPNIKIFLMHHQEEIIGQVHLVFEKDRVRLTDLAVLPHVQQKGFGQALLSYCLKYAYENHSKKITLTVAAKNQHALHLYQNVGFQIYNAVDYHKRGFLLDRF